MQKASSILNYAVWALPPLDSETMKGKQTQTVPMHTNLFELKKKKTVPHF